jgi:hypothetical protein
MPKCWIVERGFVWLEKNRREQSATFFMTIGRIARLRTSPRLSHIVLNVRITQRIAVH